MAMNSGRGGNAGAAGLPVTREECHAKYCGPDADTMEIYRQHLEADAANRPRVQ